MINYILIGMIFLSCITAFFTGNISDVSTAVISSGTTEVNLLLTIIGSMATWGGVMRVAQESGLTDKVAKLIAPVLKKIFKGVDENSKAFKAIAMNITANIFGLGNAATPLGIEAMRELEKTEAEGSDGETASRNMILLAVFNTSSVELIPTTVAALRTAHGSQAPLDILSCVLVVSVASLAVSAAFVYIFDGVKKRSKHERRAGPAYDKGGGYDEFFGSGDTGISACGAGVRALQEGGRIQRVHSRSKGKHIGGV